MATKVPVLLLAYNRPDKLAAVLDALRVLNVHDLIIAVDGPKSHIPGDAEKVELVRNVARSATWAKNLELVFRDSNIGLRAAVVASVSDAVSRFGRVIVVEDDLIPGPQMIPFMKAMLDRYADDTRIEHVSGFDMVPPSAHSFSDVRPRLTRYPESYAWATWERAWKGYDDSLEWAMDASVSDIAKIVGSTVGALRWKQNFHDAEAGRISTWAYRWLASMWSRDSYMLSPGANLSTYRGHDDGTHTVLTPRWKDLPVYDGPLEPLIREDAVFDARADKWASKIVYDESLYGISRGVAISAVLELRKNHRARKRAKAGL
ncbi:MAG: hypothetical protein NTY82_02725 [Actinobacteria bacterium]|nr:hypothetical protein [Actinomycetota bacterium]